MDTAAPLPGFLHFLSQADGVGRAILALLLAMSIASWTLILAKGISLVLERRRARRFLEAFRRGAHPLEQAMGTDPFSELARRVLGSSRGESAMARALQRALDEQATRLESGLTLLASVGSTAPFVGLFGTVWGVYHALVAIGLAGQGSLDKVAGPVGEALLMTALGLAVALPAVLGYNAFVRANRVLLAKLDGFAHELYERLAAPAGGR